MHCNIAICWRSYTCISGSSCQCQSLALSQDLCYMNLQHLIVCVCVYVYIYIYIILIFVLILLTLAYMYVDICKYVIHKYIYI
jgi:hypothetical protein